MIHMALNPWVEGTPPKARPPSQRLDTLDGKMAGLWSDGKVAARPILNLVKEGILREYLTANFTEFDYDENADTLYSMRRQEYDK